MSALLEKLYLYDILAWAIRWDYCVERATIKNTLGQSETISDVIGLPLKFVTDHYEIADDADVGTVDAILVGLTDGALQEVTLANNATSADEYFILVRGPAIINQDKIHASDPEGDAYTMATLVATLKTLGILCVSEPTKTQEQTT